MGAFQVRWYSANEIGDGARMTKSIQFTRQDTLHAALGVIPAFLLITFGSVTAGIAFAIGLLPTSLLGIAPSRKLRLLYGLLGCLFGVGVYVGSSIVKLHNIWIAALIFFVVSFAATIVSSTRPAGGLLLALLIPSLALGTSFTTAEALGLTIAFMLGSVWSSLVSLLWPEYPPDPETRARLKALQPANAMTYGVLLGLAAATAVIIGDAFDPAHAGWVAAAALFVMRPVQEMAGLRGIGRALSTIVGTALVVLTIHLWLSLVATASVVAAVAIITIGARSSRWYITAFGTAFLILTIEMFGMADFAAVHQIAWYRIFDNVIGALIALFFGLLIPELLIRLKQMQLARQAEAGESV
jgi:hypothetical protein